MFPQRSSNGHLNLSGEDTRPLMSLLSTASMKFCGTFASFILVITNCLIFVASFSISFLPFDDENQVKNQYMFFSSQGNVPARKPSPKY
ncbi:hypothetical protein DsansV1_C05g0056981 [Dioscorea sansibarensis]